MAYNANIPQPTDKLKDSQPDLLANFQSIDTVISVNHVTFDDPSGDQGKHKFVTFPSQGSAPSFGAAEDGLYNLVYSVSTVNELFVHKQTSTGTQDTPFTAGLLSTNSTPAAQTDGWTFLPSGLLIKWGKGTGNGLTTISYPVAVNIPVFTTVFSVQITTAFGSVTDTDGFVRLQSFGAATTFAVFASPRTTVGSKSVGFNYLAIGY